MLSAYPACFFKEENGYSVIFPDLELATCGDTLEDSLAMAVDCLAGRLYTAKLDNETLPDPSPIQSVSLKDIASDTYDDSDDFSESFVNLVTVDVDEYAKLHFTKSVKKTLTIPAWLNDRAIAMGINFSQVLQEALVEKLA